MAHSRKRLALGLAVVLLILSSVFVLEGGRRGLDITDFQVGQTPVTLYSLPGETGPVVVVAHGFAGSRQIMQSYSLALAQAGYRVLAFDFQGHGRNPVPMSGDVTSIDGTTRLLVEETRHVIGAARALPGPAPVALLGHSMATDILVRASVKEADAGTPVAAVVAISMFSQAVTATAPPNLLVITGQWESGLRQAGLDAVRLVDPTVAEGDIARTGNVTRKAVVAPHVEHVGVLFSPFAVNEAQSWLDDTFARHSAPTAGHRGWWILALLAGIVLGFYPLVSLLPKGPGAPHLSTSRFLLVAIGPAVVTPLLITPFYQTFLPVLIADYLMLHLALLGGLQLVLLGAWRRGSFAWKSTSVLAVWGVFVFGLALDRYAASFWPTAQRLPIIAALCLGTVPAMVADSYVTQSGRAALWRRVLARFSLFASLGAAALLDPDQLMFVLVVLPVFALFYLVHGVLGRWVGQRSGALASGIGLGLCLAWALGVSFPMFTSYGQGRQGAGICPPPCHFVSPEKPTSH